MPSQFSRLPQYLLLSAFYLFFALNAHAVGLGLEAETVQVPVTGISIEGFSAIEGYPLSISAIRQLIDAERAKYPKTMTVDELHQLADVVTLYVREKGFVFHTVYLPPQRVTDGTVRLVLQEGVLSDVHVINQTQWPDHRFSQVFDPLVGDMLYAPSVENRVQALKAQTGFQVFAFYSRGREAGQARLNLRVEPLKKRNFAVTVDNYGSDVTGKYRLVAQYTEHQLSGRFDRLSLAVLRALSDTDNTYGNIQYTLPFGSLNYSWDISASNNQFQLGNQFADLGLQGEAFTVRSGLTRHVAFHPTRRERWRAGVYHKRNRLDLNGNKLIGESEHSEAVTLEWFKDKQFLRSGWVLNGYVGVSHGRFERDNTPAQTFNKINYSGSVTHGFAGGARWSNIVQTNLRGQWSDVNLPSIERFALTGPFAVRGFEPGRFNADQAMFVSAEWRFPGVFAGQQERAWRLEPMLFADWGNGSRKGTSKTDSTSGEFSAAGLGLRFAWGKRFSGQLISAWPIHSEDNGRTVVSDELWLFEMRWH